MDLSKILFLDIETVPQYSNYNKQPERLKLLWNHKASFLSKSEEETPENLYSRAGIYAEFGKIVCISVGFIHYQNGKNHLRLKSYFGDDEVDLLKRFIKLLENHFNSNQHLLCGHNAKEFDFPYLCRRMLVNGLKIPSILDLGGKKPWEVQHLDTMQMWRFGDFKGYTSLDLLAAIFDIPSPKADISGADVGRVYWEDKGLERIAEYCQNDVVCLVQIFFKMNGFDLIEDKFISPV